MLDMLTGWLAGWPRGGKHRLLACLVGGRHSQLCHLKAILAKRHLGPMSLVATLFQAGCLSVALWSIEPIITSHVRLKGKGNPKNNKRHDRARREREIFSLNQAMSHTFKRNNKRVWCHALCFQLLWVPPACFFCFLACLAYSTSTGLMPFRFRLFLMPSSMIA